MLNNEIRSEEVTAPSWGGDAPRGGKAVMNRILKDGATVPLFFAQTLVHSLRDVGYNNTTSAVCEHIDNAIQWGADEVRVYFRQTGKRGNYEIDVAVYDNGRGMPPHVLKVATSFGGSMNYGSRDGTGRFGMGMKTAALSMSPTLEVFSWQEPGAFYRMILDIEAIGKDRSNLVELPDPELSTELPEEVADLFSKKMEYPRDASQQALLSASTSKLYDELGTSGTIIYMPQCDRLSYAQAKTLVDHAIREVSHVYRRAIAKGLRLYVNNRPVEAFDPMYAMPTARHTVYLEDVTKTSRLIVAKTVEIPTSEHAAEEAQVQLRIYQLPIDEWSELPRKTLRNDLRVFERNTVSILRNDREVFCGSMPKFTTGHSTTHWWRLQIDFPGVLDEAFGVASNKQGVRIRGYVETAIKKAIGGEITTINDEIRRYQAQHSASNKPSKASLSETKAGDADVYQAHQFPPLTFEEESQLEENLRVLATTLRHDGETEQQAFERIESSKYVIAFTHDEYWPFYDVRHKFGKVILTINTAHPFYGMLYEPLRKIHPERSNDGIDEVADSRDEDGDQTHLMALDLLLLSLARTQSRLSTTSEDASKLLDQMRREWSDSYRIQLTV